MKHVFFQVPSAQKSTTSGLWPWPVCIYCGLLRMRGQLHASKPCSGAKDEDKR